MKKVFDVYILFEPVYILSKCCCIAPNSLKKSITKQCSYIYTLLVIVLFGSFLYLTYLALEDISPEDQYIQNSITLNFDRVLASLQVLAVLIIFWTSYQHRNRLIDILSDLDDIDKATFELFKKKLPFEKVILKIEQLYLFHFLLSVIFQCGSISFGWWTNGSVQWNTVSHLITTCLKNTMLFQHISILNFVYWRFKFLNDLLKCVDKQIESDSCISTKSASTITPVLTISDIYNNETKEKFSANKESYKEKLFKEKVKDYIKLSRIVHDCLCDICRTLDEIYGYFHAVTIISTAVEQLREVFAIFLIIKSEKKDDLTYMHVARGVLQITFNVTTHFIFLFYFCNIVQKEVNINNFYST